MPARRSKKKDFSQVALDVVEAATKSELKPSKKPKEEPTKEKNPAAVALGKLGASKGGIARAKKLTSEERIAIAKRAATARWKKNKH